MNLLVTLRRRLEHKYGHSAQDIHAALARRAEQDTSRGIATRVLYLDEPGSAAPRLQLCRTLRELRSANNQLVIIGATDVVPHVMLDNPLYDERWPYRCPDTHVATDLPYGSERSEHDGLADLLTDPTLWSVSRLPDVVGAQRPDALLSSLRSLEERAPWPDPLSDCLAVSARSLADETRQCVQQATGLAIAPLCSRTEILQGLRSPQRLHVLNAHGDNQRPLVLGQDPRGREILLCSDDLPGLLTRDCVAVSMCCFGNALFSPEHAQGRLPLANAYLDHGAAAHFAPSCGTFGSANGERYASLLARLFIQHLLAGQTLGAAARLARSSYMEELGAALDDMDRVVLCQYLLFGDPSFAPVRQSAASATSTP